MSRLPELISGDSSGAAASTSAAVHSEVVLLIRALQSHEKRETALAILSNSTVLNRENREDLGPLLWSSFGTITTLLMEIISVYCSLSCTDLTERASRRASDALALFQCVASHPDTMMPFIKAHLPLYLYPFLTTKHKGKDHERLRVSSLGVIGALVKSEDPQVIHFLLETQIFPCCLNSMEVGTDISKTVATFIIHKILMDDKGLKYCCTIAERFYAVSHVLRQMIEAEEPSLRLLKFIIHCYHRLSESPSACDGLRRCLPMKLRDNTFINQLQDDPKIMDCLRKLIYNVKARQQYTRTQPVEESYGHFTG